MEQPLNNNVAPLIVFTEYEDLRDKGFVKLHKIGKSAKEIEIRRFCQKTGVELDAILMRINKDSLLEDVKKLEAEASNIEKTVDAIKALIADMDSLE